MDERLHEQLLADTDQLKQLVSSCSTQSVVGSVGAMLLKWPDEDIGLMSPIRQLFYLLGITLSTDEPSVPKDFDESEWKTGKDLLQKIFLAYAWMFWPTAAEANRVDASWTKSRNVAMPAFLHYFNSGLLASTTQVQSRIAKYLVPFDAQFKALNGISVSEMTGAADAIAGMMQSCFDELSRAKAQEDEARLAFFDHAMEQGWNDDRIRVEAQSSDYGRVTRELLTILDSLFKIQYQSFEELVGQRIALSFWKLFSIQRGDIKSFTYLTEHNPAQDRPLYLIDKTTALVPSVHAVYLAVMSIGERSLLNSDQRDSYLRHRDQTLEDETVFLFRQYFGPDAQVATSVFETSKQQYEHDLVVKWNRTLFIVEAKASPPVEPFRDADKAFNRIKHAFASDRGIQKAYEQAHRVEAAIQRGQSVHLFDSTGNEVLELSTKTIDRVYCVCVTRDNFGALSTDLSLLLEKEETDRYPWAINIFDLETLLDGWGYFSWGPERLCEYLDGRVRLNGIVAANDELEVAGFFVEHGTFDYLLEKEDSRMFLDSTYADVFDKIYDARNGGQQVTYNPHPPALADVRSELVKWSQQDANSTPGADTAKSFPKQGRNERCACGSGKKYKKCHGA